MSAVASHLPLLALRLMAVFPRPVRGVATAAEMWRGALKSALAGMDHGALKKLQAPERSDPGNEREPSPTHVTTPGYVLRVEPASGYEGSAHWLHVTLFGERAAKEHASALLYGVLSAERSGVGRDQLRFLTESLQCRAESGWQSIRAPLRRSEWAGHLWRLPMSHPARTPMETCPVRFALQAPGRLVLREQGRPVLDQPEASLLVQQLLARANRVGRVWCEGEIAATEEVRALEAASGRVYRVVEDSRVHVIDRQLSSRRQGGFVPSPGVGGTFVYEAEPADFSALLPVLRLGQWIHVGQQSTAGMGHYRLLVEAR